MYLYLCELFDDMNMEETIKSVIATFSIDENKIIRIVLNNTAIEKEDVVDAINVLKQLGKNMPTGKLIDARLHHSITKEAKKYWEESVTFSSSFALAYVINSNTRKNIANLYLKIVSPKVKMRFFTEHSEAYEWLKTNPFTF
jgi:hypothetical protein